MIHFSVLSNVLQIIVYLCFGQDTNEAILQERKQIVAVAISPDGKMAISLEYPSGDVYVWHFPDGQQIGILQGPKNLEPKTVAFSPDGDELVVSYNSALVFWNIGSKKIIRTIKISGGGPVSYSPSGAMFAASVDGKVIVWNRKNHQIRQEFTTNRGGDGPLQFSKDSQYIIEAVHDRDLHVWKLDSVEKKVLRSSHDANVSDIVFSGDGALVLSSSWDRLIFWDWRSGKPTKELRHERTVVCISLDKSTNLLIFGTQGAGIHLWDTKRQKNEKVFNDESSVSNTAISPDGRHLFVAFSNMFAPNGRKLSIIKLSNTQR